jgi:hypothetical protein
VVSITLISLPSLDMEDVSFAVFVFFLGVGYIQYSRIHYDHPQSDFFLNSFFELVPYVGMQSTVFSWIQVHG